MIILLHVAFALSSLVFTTYLYYSPSRAKLRASYALVAGTLLSGTYLIATTPTHILSTCESGLFYLGAVSVGIAFSRNKLSKQEKNHHS